MSTQAVQTEARDLSSADRAEPVEIMTPEQAALMLAEGRVEEWNDFRETFPHWIPALSPIGEGPTRSLPLGGVSLPGVNLRFADCRGVDFRATDLSDADLRFARLQGANLSQARLAGAMLTQADITGAIMRGADIRNTDVTGLLYDRRRMPGCYRGLHGASSCHGHRIFRRDAEDQDYLDTLENAWRGSWKHIIFRLWGLIDYGRSMIRVGLGATALMALFGLVFLIAEALGIPLVIAADHTPKWWLTPFYYSVVTYTTLGYGDITPATKIGQVVVMTEVVLGYLTLGLLLAILANTVARRS